MLVGVRRSCACPGAQTITLRSWPTSECTPKAVLWAFAMMTSLASNCDVAGCEPVNADDGADHRNGKDDPFHRGEDSFVLLPPRPKIECSTGGVEDRREQQKLHPAGEDDERRIDRRNSG